MPDPRKPVSTVTGVAGPTGAPVDGNSKGEGEAGGWAAVAMAKKISDENFPGRIQPPGQQPRGIKTPGIKIEAEEADLHEEPVPGMGWPSLVRRRVPALEPLRLKPEERAPVPVSAQVLKPGVELELANEPVQAKRLAPAAAWSAFLTYFGKIG